MWRSHEFDLWVTSLQSSGDIRPFDVVPVSCRVYRFDVAASRRPGCRGSGHVWHQAGWPLDAVEEDAREDVPSWGANLRSRKIHRAVFDLIRSSCVSLCSGGGRAAQRIVGEEPRAHYHAQPGGLDGASHLRPEHELHGRSGQTLFLIEWLMLVLTLNTTHILPGHRLTHTHNISKGSGYTLVHQSVTRLNKQDVSEFPANANETRFTAAASWERHLI